jgi:hypothetical protein
MNSTLNLRKLFVQPLMRLMQKPHLAQAPAGGFDFLLAKRRLISDAIP